MDERSCHAPRDERRTSTAGSSRGSRGCATRSSPTSTEHGEVGAAVCVYVDGRPVVDLWGGVADRRRAQRWVQDTVVPVFSSTKGVTAVAANLAIERGLLDPDAPVASSWPEFAAAGKEAITVRQVLSHQAGLPLVEGTSPSTRRCRGTRSSRRWPPRRRCGRPGTQHGYHMRTYGWLVGELLRRVDRAEPGPVRARRGRRPARPRHLDRPARGGRAPRGPGGPAAEQPPRAARAARRDAAAGPGVRATRRTCSTTTTCGTRRALHACELPSSNGIGDARSFARLYASLVGDGVDGHAHAPTGDGRRGHGRAGARHPMR